MFPVSCFRSVCYLTLEEISKILIPIIPVSYRGEKSGGCNFLSHLRPRYNPFPLLWLHNIPSHILTYILTGAQKTKLDICLSDAGTFDLTVFMIKLII